MPTIDHLRVVLPIAPLRGTMFLNGASQFLTALACAYPQCLGLCVGHLVAQAFRLEDGN